MKSFLASIFRRSNSKLIYPQAWISLKFRKLIFFVSNFVYRYWLKKSHAPNSYILKDIDVDITMEVDTSKVIGAAFYWIGFHEFKEWRYLQRYLKPEMVFLDVGANQGEYSLFAAKRLTSGSVIAFEPVDKIYQKLQYNISMNKFPNIRTYNLGLSDVAGIVPIYEMDSEGANNEGLATLYQSEVRGKMIQQIKLDILDNLMSDFNLSRIDFIKVDIEGAELSMLKGARETIARFRPMIMVEMNSETFNAAGYTQGAIIDFFTELHYKPHYIDSRGGLSPQVSADRMFTNIVFVPQ